MTRVSVPPGCRGLDMQDGTRYTVPRDGQVHVADRHADAIRRGWYGQSGVMVLADTVQAGTKTTRWCGCTPGGRAWQAWTTVCPRCGTPTTEEQPT